MKKSIFEQLIIWLAVPIGVVSFFATNKFWFGMILTLSLLRMFYLTNIFARRVCQCYREYSRKKACLLRRCENSESTYFYKLGMLKEYTRNRFFRRYFCVIGERWLFFLSIVIITCACDIDKAKAYYNNLKALVGLEDKENGDVQQIKEDLDLDEERRGEAVFSKQQEKERKNSTWRFIIDNRNGSKFTDSEREQQVFFCCLKEEIKWESYVQNYIEDIFEEEKRGINYKLIEDANGNSFFTYTELEDAFKDKVEEVASYRYYDDWIKVAPNSKELDYYISGREYLNQIDCEGERGCFKIWYQLANDYQYYAQEYERQTNNMNAVRYYYINSIYCCMQGLRYSVSKVEKDKLYHYMVMRYHDMADEQSKVTDDDRKRASKIHSLLVEWDSLSSINHR